MSDLVERLRQLAEEPDAGIEVLTYDTGDASACLRSVAPWGIDAGFVPVLTPDEPGRSLPATLRHRHALLVCGPGESQRTAIRWMRELARASPRRHFIVAPPRPPTVDDVEREQSAEPAPAFATESAAAVRIDRARRWRRRGRARIGERWLIAAVEAVRRRGDRSRAAVLDFQLIESLIGRDALADASQRLREYVANDTGWPVYAQAAALRTDVLVARSELGAARAWVSSIHAEAQLRGDSSPPAIAVRTAELDFWQGRSWVRKPTPCDSDLIGWQALRAWSAGDTDWVRDVIKGVDGYWRVLIELLSDPPIAAEDVAARLKALHAEADQAGGNASRRRLLAAAVAARSWRALGDTELCRAVLASAHGGSPEALLCHRLKENRHPVSIFVGRDPPGVERLASWRNEMQLVEGLSHLLAVFENADDELGVLKDSCEWLCRRAGALRAAIVSADSAILLAAAGWRQTDLAGEIAEILHGPAGDVRGLHDGTSIGFGASVRSLGRTSGFVVVRARTTDLPALQQSALTVAALCGPAVRARLDAIATRERSCHSLPEIVGHSPLIVSVREAIVRAATAPFPVLVEGESGTGKELVARALHRLGPRRDRRLSAVNCAALNDELVEAELFGHVRGAFTGAIGPRIGLFEESHGSTLFLDEVTEMSPRAQAKLLRVLQEGEIRRVGENHARTVDVRIVAACNVPVAEAVANGRFRDDLRFRLAVIRITLPPLRDRVEDIPGLALTFWRRAAVEGGTRAILGPDALARLTRHGWPGNVRELQNAVAGLVVAAPPRGRVGARHVDQVLSQTSTVIEMPGVRLEAARRTFERRMIMSALTRHAGRRHAAAAELGLSRQGLAKALRRLGLSTDHHAAGVA